MRANLVTVAADGPRDGLPTVSAGSGPDRDQGSLGGRDVLPRRAVRETRTRPGGRWRPVAAVRRRLPRRR